MTEPSAAPVSLREQALQAMVSGAVRPSLDTAANAVDPLQLLEELRIHQAELEVQNGELQRTHQEADGARRYYESLFNGLPIVALVIDASGLIAEANARAIELFGFRSAAALRQHSIYRLMLRSSGTELADRLSQHSAQETTVLPRLVMHSVGGEPLEMEAHLTCLTPAVRLDRRYLLLMLDRTREIANAQQAQLFETILNHAGSLIYAFDREGRCIFANDSMLTLIARKRDEVIGHKRSAWINEEDARQHEMNDAVVLSTGNALVYEEKLHSAGNASRYFISHKFALRDGDGEVFAVAGISTDVTETKASGCVAIAAPRRQMAVDVDRFQ